MEHASGWSWHPALADPSGIREPKPRRNGRTMVIDKGLGLRAFEDLVRVASAYIDFIKLGFGTAALYPGQLLTRKIELAKAAGIHIMPGGTFLEVAVAKDAVDAFFRTAKQVGFSALEVSDGTIEMSRNQRSSLIVRGLEEGFAVVSEFGKKMRGFSVQAEDFARTVQIDTDLGADFVTVEARESGRGVGIFDDNGDCKAETLDQIVACIPNPSAVMWEAPLKSQQAELLRSLGADINIGNVAPEDALSLEALRRGLRSDTFQLGRAARVQPGSF